MLKQLIALMVVGLMLGSAVVVGAGVVIGGARTSGGETPSADYVPATIEIREGGDSLGTKYKVAIYKVAGTNTGDLVANAISSEFDRHGTMGTQSGTFTDADALVGGDNYIVAVLADGDIIFGSSGPLYRMNSQSVTYPTFGSTCNLSNGDIATEMIEFVVKNANGDTLLSHGDMTTTNTTIVPSNRLQGNNTELTLTCVTL